MSDKRQEDRRQEDRRLEELIDGLLDESLSAEDRGELCNRLRNSAEARRQYWDSVAQHLLVEDILRESRGQDLAAVEQTESELADSNSFVALANPPLARNRLWRVAICLAATCAALVVGWVVLSRPTSDGIRLARLRSLSGSVNIRDTVGRLRPASSGLEIHRGEAVVVSEEDATADIVLDDGSAFHLDADSVLSFSSPRAGKTCELRLERGGLLVDAMPQAVEQPLVLTTEHASVNVQGTRFRLYTDGAMSRVELNEGSVRFQQQADGQSVEVAEGYYAVALAKGSLPENSPPMSAQPLSRAECQLRQTLLRAGRLGCISHDGRFFAAPRKGSLNVWSLETGELVESVSRLSPSHFKQVVFSADDRAVVAIDGTTATVWRRGDAAARVYPLHGEHVRHTVVSPDGTCIAQSYSSHKTDLVALWRLDLARDELTSGASLPLKPWSSSLAATSSAAFVAAGEWSGQIHVIDAQVGEVCDKLRVRSTAFPLAIADSGRLVAAFTNKEGLVLLARAALTDADRRVLWSNSGARPACLRFSADDGLLFAGMDNGLVRVWSTVSSELLLVLETGDPKVAWLDVSDGGDCLVTGGQHDSVKIWNCQWPN